MGDELIRKVWGEYGVMGLDLICRSDSDNKIEFSSQHKAQALIRTLDAAGYPTGQLLEDVLEVRTTLGNEPTETDIREAMKDLRTFPHNHHLSDGEITTEHHGQRKTSVPSGMEW